MTSKIKNAFRHPKRFTLFLAALASLYVGAGADCYHLALSYGDEKKFYVEVDESLRLSVSESMLSLTSASSSVEFPADQLTGYAYIDSVQSGLVAIDAVHSVICLTPTLIRLKGEKGNNRCMISDVSGKAVSSFSFPDEYEIPLSDFGAGIYILTVANENKSYSFKYIVK